MQNESSRRLWWRLGLAAAFAAVVVSDSHVKAQCRFTVLSVDSANNTMRGRLIAQVSASSYKTANKLAWVFVHCRVISAEPPNIIDSVSMVAEANRRHARESAVITIPKTSVSPLVCAEETEYRLRNGDVGVLDMACA
jgi:hypothetical protein